MSTNEVAAGAPRATTPGLKVRLRPTMLSDLDFVQSVEDDPANRPFITPWERTQHEGAIRFPDFRHFIVEAGEGWPSAGFVILQGCRNPHGAVELKRIVLQPKGLGYGRALRAAARRDGVSRPRRAPLLARRQGAQRARPGASTATKASSRRAGCATACAAATGYESLIVMSMLRDEHEARLRAVP